MIACDTYVSPTDLSHACFAGYFSYHVLTADEVLGHVHSFDNVPHVSTEVCLAALALIVIPNYFV